MRILITNCILCTRSGTETYVRDLALGLLSAGQEPMVYSPVLGEIAEEIARAGIPVTDRLDRLPAAPEVIQGHHYCDTARAMLAYPEAGGVFVCHAWRGQLNTPPRLSGLRRFVAVDHLCRGWLLSQDWLPSERVRVIPNAVDLGRFRRGPPLPDKPRRALIFSNYAGKGTHREPVFEACRTLGLAVDIVGYGSGTGASDPETFLTGYDLIFAKARCALESMAVGAAVVLCDASGLGQMVTRASVESMQLFNFGRRLLHRPLDPALIVEEIRRYDAIDATSVSLFIRERASLDVCVRRLLDIYRDVLEEKDREPGRAATGRYAATSTVRIREAVRLHSRLAWMRLYFDHCLPNRFFRSRIWPLIRRWRENRVRVAGVGQRRMDALPDSLIAQLELAFVDPPAEIYRNAPFKVRVRVRNRTGELLGSHLPVPVHLVWGWVAPSEGWPPDRAGGEIPLLPGIPGGEEASFTITVRSPSVPGVSRLLCTMIQSGMRPFDQASHPLYAEAMIQVR